MGCVGSKLDDMPAVALCRERSSLLEAAIRHRYALSQAHLSYLHSLKSLASSLDRFFNLHRQIDLDLIEPSASPPISPVHLSRSDSGSHLDFHSDSSGSPLHHDDLGFPLQTLDPTSTRYYAHYDRRRSSEPVRFEGSYPNPSSSYSFSSYPDPYLNYAGIGGFYSHSSSSQAEAPPPIPPPPSASTWDFLNPFETSANYYELKGVSKEEGIPDFEVVKEVDEGGEGGYLEVGGGGGIGGEGEFGLEENGAEYEVHMVEKKVVVNEGRVGKEKGNVGPTKAGGMRGVLEVVSEIKAQFDRASDAGGEVAKMLEVGKLPYCGRNAVYKGRSLLFLYFNCSAVLCYSFSFNFIHLPPLD